MYIGLAPKILGIGIEHFASVFVSNYLEKDKTQDEDDTESDLEMYVKVLFNIFEYVVHFVWVFLI